MLPLQMIPIERAFMVLITLSNAWVSITMTHTSDLLTQHWHLPYPQELKPQTQSIMCSGHCNVAILEILLE